MGQGSGHLKNHSHDNTESFVNLLLTQLECDELFVGVRRDLKIFRDQTMRIDREFREIRHLDIPVALPVVWRHNSVEIHCFKDKERTKTKSSE